MSMRLSLVYPRRLVPYAQRRAAGAVHISNVIFAGLRVPVRNVSTTSAVSGAADATATAAADAEKLLQSTAAKHLPRPIFPWRHEEELLPRFIPGTPEYSIRLPLIYRAITRNPVIDDSQDSTVGIL
jgi:hypothetical protein